jgi:hypothetical protein
MAPPWQSLLVLHEKKEVDSINIKVAEVQYTAPPVLDDEIDLNKQFEIHK